MSIELHTQRLWLRPITAADRDALQALWAEPEVRRFLWDDRVVDLTTVDGVIERSAASFTVEGFGNFALREGEGAALIGTCGLYRAAPSAEPELLYSLAPGCWGRGLATEAARAVVADAFARLGLSRLLARADVPNRASIGVMQRLGFEYEGEREEGGLRLASYLLTRESWEAPR